MAGPYDILFEPLTLKGLTLRNRLVMPPMVSNRDVTGAESRAWYARHAAGGVGLVIVEATRIHRFDHDLTAAQLAPLAAAIHHEGAAAMVQLFFQPPAGCARPADLSAEQIATGLAQFARAAAVCREAGFDGVEPHGAHGFLLNQFFSPAHNQRLDGYGGDLAGRMRLGLEVVRAVRAAVDDACVVLYRHTPVTADSYGLDDSLTFARELVAAGVDGLDISPSSDQAPADRAAPFKALGLAPVIGVGRLGEVDRAAAALHHGRCDLVAIGRGLIADPDWPDKVRRGHEEDLLECTECNVGCFGRLREGLPIDCVRRLPQPAAN